MARQVQLVGSRSAGMNILPDIVHPMDAIFAPVLYHYPHEMHLGDEFRGPEAGLRSVTSCSISPLPPEAATAQQSLCCLSRKELTTVSAQNKDNEVFFTFMLCLPTKPWLAVYLGKE